MTPKVRCLYCNSPVIEESHSIEGVFECLDCGEFFEDEDYKLKIIRRNLSRKHEKEMLNS